ncbi:uncharacterized protein LOC127122457 [Lathyrus oleraceus]|uniref:uncharacterized protein LOC127122457 n=1 Tax=Pisum sativum TaxID=3888 RepID=UPI0021CF9A15|nr:uncharacterized protein LOC127122457 [Pisum sativum]
MTNAEGNIIPKPEAQWTADDEKKWAYDWKAQNILISVLGVEEYYRVSHCMTSKEMWDALQVSHEGINEVKQSRINTLTQKFELFRMKQEKYIFDMQERFIHLINNLNSLGKHISNELATNKVLRCLSREWKPKVTAIKEANDLTTLDITTLFGKLEEHQQELARLEKYEKKIKKEKTKDKESEKKSIALVASNSKSSNKEQSDSDSSSDEDSDDEEVGLFVRSWRGRCKEHESTRIEQFDEGLKEFGSKMLDEVLENLRENGGKSGRALKPDYPQLKKDKGKAPPKKYNKQIRAYIAWESDSESPNDESSSDNDGTANICLMAHIKNKAYHKSLNKEKKMHTEALAAFKRLSSDKQIFSFLEGKVYKTEKDLDALKESIIENSKDIDGLIERLASEERRWFLDSGSSRHMTGEISLFIDFKAKKRGYVSYGNNNKGEILGKGSVGNPYTITISDVNLVEGLKHNILSISQLCDKGYKVTFTNTSCIIEHNDKKDIVFKGVIVNKIYMLNLIEEYILKDVVEGSDQPKIVDIEKEEDISHVKDEEECPNEVYDLPLAWKSSRDHPIDNILGDTTKGVRTRSKLSLNAKVWERSGCDEQFKQQDITIQQFQVFHIQLSKNCYKKLSSKCSFE